MKKLALCFLVYSELEHENLWCHWILNNKDKLSVTIHSKNELKLNSEDLQTFVTKIDTIETKWGDFSLVEATLSLFKKALEDPDVQYCVILSGACIPIKPFEYVYNEIMNANGKTFVNKMGKTRTQNIPVSKKDICKHAQWIIVSREHIEYFLKEIYRIKFIFKRPDIIPDELWCATFLNLNKKGHEIIYKQTTFTNWVQRDGTHPKTYKVITDKELDDILTSDRFFARKFTKTSFTESQYSQIVCRIQNS